MTEETQSVTLPKRSSPWQRLRAHLPADFSHSLWEFVILILVAGYFLFYGLTPYFGGDQVGLVGADEPRYAQIAREMLAAHSVDCHEVHARITPHSLRAKDLHASYECLIGGTVTPVLYGRPWLEKPALYYWRAMSFFKEFGVSDWSARLPSVTAAGALIILAFLHLRRFRPGGHLDAALIMVSMAGMVGFARGASTDMQLAAPLSMGLLGWYAWYETGKKFWLFDLYFFGAAATLAKGPVAIFLMLGTIMLFLGLRREWQAIRRSLWLPGLGLFLLMVLPWYIEVQLKNPHFFRIFFLEHNIERFATDRYQHSQHWFYYVLVLIIALLPWTAIALRALFDGMAVSIDEWKVRHKPQRYLGHVRAGDAFPEFLCLWALLPVVFFSFSVSKLPGYILPSLPPLAILAGDYLFRSRRNGISHWLLYLHASLTGFMTFVVLLCPQYMIYEKIVPPLHDILWAALLGVLAALLIIVVVRVYGVRHLRTITLVPLVGLMYFLLGMNGHLLDLNYSARPLAREIRKADPTDQIVAVYDVRRDLDYGLAFYRDQDIVHYDTNGVPAQGHILVIPTKEASELPQILPGRTYQQLFLYNTQGLSVYKVYPRG
ncbi:MAG TPA: glycosyltransferase family 39 protein [Candidatus Aquilonibacter sp.]|nr:glycosyltransferase family 39 protein [Candidatus Aquilonibacter sp.]